MADPILPAGFNPVPAGQFVAGAHKGKKVAYFGMKTTPVTNAEYGALAKSLGKDRYVLLEHNFENGETKFVRKGATAKTVAARLIADPDKIDVIQGAVLIMGSMILVKMVDNPSVRVPIVEFGERPGTELLYCGADRPVVHVSYFHAMAWCLLKSLENGGKYEYDLPTDLQYEYVASDRGTKEYGTETGSLYKDGRKLAHVDDNGPDGGTSVAVNDPRFAQKLPFWIQTTGNVLRWMKYNPYIHDSSPYGTRGGSWLYNASYALATTRISNSPNRIGAVFYNAGDDIGFSPVVMPRDSSGPDVSCCNPENPAGHAVGQWAK